MVTRVILVRHGESSFNVERRVQGFLDESTLTDQGQAMAHQVGEALSEISFDAVYSSTLRRAKDTAEIVLTHLKTAPKVPLQPVDSLKEINLMLWEGMLFGDVEKIYPNEYEQWKNYPHKLSMMIPQENGETAEYFPVVELFDRAQQFWQEFLPNHGNQTVLLVAHSGINRALIGTAIGLNASGYQAVQQSNCGISVLNFAGGWGDLVQVESLNQTAHLGEPLPNPKQGYHTRLLLVRHGETEWNRQKRFQGQIDVPLNDNGRSQSNQAAEFLKAIPIDHAITSPMLRPKETAEVILQHHPDVALDFEDNLKEISHGLWEGKLESEIEQEFPGELQRWQQTPEVVQMPAGENLQQVWDRATTAWDEIVQAAVNQPKPGTTLVVAHDAVNKAILCYVLGLEPNRFWSFKQGNGAVSVIDYAAADQPPVMMAMNITAHLDGGVLDKTAAGAL
ncbi:histidine phosphatase family protein [Phormidium sp. CLA17]|nr:histidine phosphatase family protein [Leptolyngbya sp. Cla-17]